jgi:CHAD domain-containing protein
MAGHISLHGFVDEQLSRLEAMLAETLSTGAAEPAHQVRVATRRLDAPVRLCGAVAHRGRARRVLRTLRRVRRSLAVVRELDVLTLSMEGSGPATLSPGQAEELAGVVRELRQRRYRRARRKLARHDPGEFARHVRSILEACGDPGSDTYESLKARLSDLLAGRARRILGRSPREGGSGDLHATRVALKRLRYALELRTAIEGGEDAETMKSFKAMQEILGEWNDQVQAARHLASVVRRRRTLVNKPVWSAAILRLGADHLDRAQAIAVRFAAGWPRFEEMLGRLAADA